MSRTCTGINIADLDSSEDEQDTEVCKTSANNACSVVLESVSKSKTCETNVMKETKVSKSNGDTTNVLTNTLGIQQMTSIQQVESVVNDTTTQEISSSSKIAVENGFQREQSKCEQTTSISSQSETTQIVSQKNMLDSGQSTDISNTGEEAKNIHHENGGLADKLPSNTSEGITGEPLKVGQIGSSPREGGPAGYSAEEIQVNGKADPSKNNNIRSTVQTNGHTHGGGEKMARSTPAFVPNDRESADSLVQRILAESKGNTSINGSKVSVDISGGFEAAESPGIKDNVAGHSGVYDGVGRTKHDDVLDHRYSKTHTKDNSYLHRADGGISAFDSEGRGAGSTMTAGSYGYDETLIRKRGYKNELMIKESTSNITDKHDFDELDQDIASMKQQLHESALRRNKGNYPRYDDDDDVDDDVRPYGGATRYRGRVMRQRYIEDDDVDYRAEEEEEELLPDDAFDPQRREETEDMVKERTQGIRRVVENQTAVLDKLRRASESFDDLNSEIRAMRQEFIERTASRSFSIDEDNGLDYDDEPPPRAQRWSRAGAKSCDGDYSGCISKEYASYMSNRSSSTLDRELQSDSLTTGNSLVTLSGYRSLARYKDNDDDDVENMPFSSSSREPVRKTFLRPQFGRPRSIYDSQEYDSRGADDDTQDTTATGKSYGYTRSQYSSSRLNSSYASRSSYDSADGGAAALGSSGGSGGYNARFYNRPVSMASSTGLYDNFDHSPTSSVYGGSGSDDRPFSSRFLNKVRKGGTVEPSKTSVKPRDKPFKSRFLRSSFDSEISSKTSSSSISSQRHSSMLTRSTSNPNASTSSPVNSTSTPETPTVNSGTNEETEK